jgi:hypothetical protein
VLELTPAAAEVIRRIVSQTEMPDSAGMRITSHGGQPAANGSAPARDIHLSVVDAPQDDDEVVDGAPVYVEPGPTATMLDDKVLDAEVGDEMVEFRLLEGEERPAGD